jgi:hypothetical protein
MIRKTLRLRFRGSGAMLDPRSPRSFLRLSYLKLSLEIYNHHIRRVCDLHSRHHLICHRNALQNDKSRRCILPGYSQVPAIYRICSGIFAGEFLRSNSNVASYELTFDQFFLWGLSYGLLDVLNKHFLTICMASTGTFHVQTNSSPVGLTKVQSTLLQFAYFFSYFLMSPVMSLFIQKYGYKKVSLTLTPLARD